MRAAEIPPEPFGDRRTKSLLGPVDDLIREEPLDRFLERVLAYAVPHFQSLGEGEGELDKVMIQERTRASTEVAIVILSTRIRRSSASRCLSSRYVIF